MILFYTYIALTIIITTFDEHWNATHPNPFPRKHYIVMNWDKNDFYHYKISKTYAVLIEKEDDGKYKALARRAWHERKNK